MGTTYPSPNALTTSNVSNSSVQVAQPNLQRAALYVFNTSAADTLWVSPSGTVATVQGVGSVAIQPLQGQVFGAPNSPPWTNGMNAIFSAAGTHVVSILEYYQ